MLESKSKNEPQVDVTIIGAGLTGLALAYFLKDEPISLSLIEARDRIGGRILTLGYEQNQPREMGATWLGKRHLHLIQLLEELSITVFEQELGSHAHYEPMSLSPPQRVKLPPNNDPSFRISGGSETLLYKLKGFLGKNKLHLGETVTSIKQEDEMLKVSTAKSEIRSSSVVSTLPPYLFHESVLTEPELPAELMDVCSQTHTWMGDAIKISLSFEAPFWRTTDSSGTVFSNVGPVPELYDHSNYEENFHALVGFLDGTFFPLTKNERLALILKQLRKYFGPTIDQYSAYDELIWRLEKETFREYDQHVLPHHHNGHTLYQAGYMDNRLFIAGSETAMDSPGYMEGAVSSAKSIAKKLISHFK